METLQPNVKRIQTLYSPDRTNFYKLPIEWRHQYLAGRSPNLLKLQQRKNILDIDL